MSLLSVVHKTRNRGRYDLVRALVQHAVDTFGLAEVQKWFGEMSERGMGPASLTSEW